MESTEQATTETLVEAAMPDPVEVAAQTFSQTLPIFKNLVNSIEGKKSLGRVLTALAEFPLGAQKPRLLNERERQLFYVFQELVNNKQIVLNDIMSKMKTKPAAEPVATENGEVSNG